MPKRGYHHGNLRQALVDAALELIETKGPTGFTLSEAAKQAGVTPAAVYRHFAGRDDLIAEAARQGYEIFADLMDYAYQSGQPSALASFEATGRAYLAFAKKYPGHYVAMFESGISVNRTPDLALVANRASEVQLTKIHHRAVILHEPRVRGAGARGRSALGTYSARKTATPANVFSAYLGHEPRRGRALRPRQPGSKVAVSSRRSA